MLTLVRDYKKFKHCVVGKITLPDGSEIETLERPWVRNKSFISCIPEGEYKVNRDHTGKHKFYRLEHVEDRTDIEIHPASVVTQLQGCIAPCMSTEGGIARDSIKACNKLIEFFGEDSFILKIVS